MNSFIEFDNFISISSYLPTFVITIPLPTFLEFLIEFNVIFLANFSDSLIFLFFIIAYNTAAE